MLLSRAMTVYALLEEYPFLEDFLVGRHAAFAPLARSGPRRTWARVTTLGEAATLMDQPSIELLRDIRAEVLRVRGVAPAIAADVTGAPVDPRLAHEVRGLVARLEDGAPLAELSRLFDELTAGLDAEALGEVAQGAERPAATGLLEAVSGAWHGAPLPHITLYPGHPVRALEQEGARLAGLASYVEEALASLGEPPDPARWKDAAPVVKGLLARLAEVDRQARRLRLAWYAALARRGARSVATVIEDRLGEAVAAVRRALLLMQKDDPGLLVAAVPRALHLVRHALLTEEELLVPVALRALDDDDWEAVAEQERIVGWALMPRDVPPARGGRPGSARRS